MPDDAIYVFCNMTGSGETCVYPDLQSSKMPNIPWRKESGKEDWYSNMRGASKVLIESFHVLNDKQYLIWLEYKFVVGDVRNGRRRSDDFPPAPQSKGLSELYVHVRQFGCLVQSAYFQLRSGYQTSR